MKFKFEVILATELDSGDIFYCTPDEELNEFGEDYTLTGTDQIFIKDDYYDEDDDGNYAILVNGGWNIWFRPGEKVVRLGHYRKLVRVIDMIKEGNPDMALGPNDNITAIQNYLLIHPEQNNLLEGWDIDFNDLKKDEKDGDNNNDDELPF
ncbi:MAG: hypothetical protein IPK35_01485 [Saprospiraceae bacterium]|jgi:hypothetical protein|nr:hypothetical protein [Saprospiraceae bacterium]